MKEASLAGGLFSEFFGSPQSVHGAGLLAAGQVSSDIADALTGTPTLSGGTPNCVANCEAVRDAALWVAAATYAAAAGAATAILVAGAAACARGGAVGIIGGPWTVAATVACFAAVALVYGIAIAAATAVYNAHLNQVNAVFVACMAGCGWYPL